VFGIAIGIGSCIALVVVYVTKLASIERTVKVVVCFLGLHLSGYLIAISAMLLSEFVSGGICVWLSCWPLLSLFNTSYSEDMLMHNNWIPIWITWFGLTLCE
jgi:hypothetical protein